MMSRYSVARSWKVKTADDLTYGAPAKPLSQELQAKLVAAKAIIVARGEVKPTIYNLTKGGWVRIDTKKYATRRPAAQ
jgi:hypothetical protein